MARLDVAALEAPWQWLDGLERAIQRGAPRGSLILCVFTDDEAAGVDALDTLAPLLTRAPRPILHRIIVCGSRWRILDSHDDAWHEVRLPDFPDRRRLVEELAPAAEIEREEIAGLISAVPLITPADREGAVAHAVALLNSGADGSLDDVAALLMGLRDLGVRDTLLWDLVRQKPRTWARVGDALMRAVRLAPATHVAPAACLLAIMRWQIGDGTRAVIALERALQAEPEYSLAHLVDAMVSGGLHPQEWREGLAGLSRQACLGPSPAGGM